MYYTEVTNISPQKHRKITTNVHRQSLKEALPSERFPQCFNVHFNGERIDANKKLDTKKNKLSTNKLKTHGSHKHSYEIPSHSKKENKANSDINRAIDVKKKEFTVKKIPLNNDLEFSIDRNHCPMVVRVHKGYLNKPKKKDTQEKSHLKPPSHSLSCPPCLDKKCTKVTTESNNVDHKAKQHRSKCKLLSHGYTIAGLLNLSPRKSGVSGPMNKVINLNANVKKIKKSSSKRQMSSRAEDNVKNVDKNSSTSKKNVRSHSSTGKEKCYAQYIIPSPIKITDEKMFTNCDFPYVRKGHKYCDFNNQIRLCVSPALEDNNCENFKDIPTHMKQLSIAPNNKFHRSTEKCFLESQCEDEIMTNENVLICNCQRCKTETIANKRKKQTNISECQPLTNVQEANINDTVGVSVFEPQECFGMKNTDKPTEVGFFCENVVTLDASQSQFYKISAFLKNKTSKHIQTVKQEQLGLNISSTAINKKINLSVNDQSFTKKTEIIKEIYASGFKNPRKSRSEEKHLNTDQNNCNILSNSKRSVSCINRLRCYSSFVPNVNSSGHTVKDNLGCEIAVNHNQFLPSYKCISCSKSASEVMSFHPYCSDCKLKQKLSQISNESGSTDPGSMENKTLVPVYSSTNLTAIPGSDKWSSKNHINVAIQTDCGYLEECNKGYDKINNSFGKNISLSIENLFKMYLSMAPQFKSIQELQDYNLNEFQAKNHNINLNYPQNSITGDFVMGIQENETGNSLHEYKYPSSTDNLELHTILEPNIHSYRVVTTNNKVGIGDTQETFDESTNSTNPLGYQCKSLESPFVSPIFPEKEYNRITCNKYNSDFITNSLNESCVSKNNTATKKFLQTTQENMEVDCGLKFKTRPTADKVSSGDSDQNKTLPQFSDIISYDGSYISAEKRITLCEYLMNANNISQFVDKNNKSSFCERGTFTKSEEDFSPILLHSTTNIKNSYTSLDSPFCSLTKKNSTDGFETNIKQMLPKEIDEGGLTCVSEYKPLQFKLCRPTSHATECYDSIPKNTFLNDYKEFGFINNKNENSMQKDMFMKITTACQETSFSQKESSQGRERSNSSIFHDPLNTSNLDFKLQFIKLVDPADKIRNALKKRTDYEVARNMSHSLRVINNKEKLVGPSNNCMRGLSESSDLIKKYSIPYIYFNISIPNNENDSSGWIEEYCGMQDFSKTGFLLMPEKFANANYKELNDVIKGNIFQTVIKHTLISQTNINSHEFNVYELLKTPTELSTTDKDGESDLKAIISGKKNFKKEYKIYKAISPTVTVNGLNKNNSNQIEITNYCPASLVTVLDSSTPVIELQFEIHNNQSKTYNRALKKKKYITPTEKNTNNNGKNKFTKINNLFMCSYKAQINLFQFIGSLQTKVCSQFKKSKLV